MTGWLRPPKRSLSVCGPCSPSKVYCFSTCSHGRSRRSRLSWSRIRVNSFSFARCLFRALSHSSCFTTLWVAMPCLLLERGSRSTLLDRSEHRGVVLLGVARGGRALHEPPRGGRLLEREPR